MTRKQKEEQQQMFLLIGLGVLLIWFATRKKAPGKSVEVVSDFVLEAYRDLITTEDNMNYQGVPLHIYLARNTANYDAVKKSYNSTYGGNFSIELANRLAGQMLSEYVAELFKTGQVMTP